MKIKSPLRIALLCALPLLLVGLISCSKQSEQHPLVGVWKHEHIGNGNVTIPTFFVFEQNEGELDGYVIMNFSMKVDFDNVVDEGDRATFDIFWGVDYEVDLEDGKLVTQTTWSGDEPSERIFIRASRDEIEPPAAKPLPELKKVPANGLAMTPPMGWNSWNHFALEINDQIIREIAEAMVSSGMAAAGYEYVVIDDGWQGGRDSDGNIYPNDQFPDMKALADYVHSLGLKLGIYSSPGHTSCGGYIGSYRYEFQDAKTFASWGIDYLKYDWCGAQLIYESNRENVQASYQIMGEALLECGRPIVYSVCNYGETDVWEWAADVGGNLWRTTGDIHDTWHRVTEIGFSQHELYPYAKPGHWNDPDMLEVGNGGFSVVQNQTHFTLWCMLAAPLMAGNDLRSMPQETIDVLTNPDVIAINQDVLGKQAQRLSAVDNIEVYAKALSEGELATAIFNRNETETEVTFSWRELGWEERPVTVTNIWAKEAVPTDTEAVTFTIPAHGTVLLRGGSSSKQSDPHPLVGVWKSDKIGNGGVTISDYFIFEQSEDSWSGRVLMNFSMRVEFDNMVVEDDQATFDIFWGVNYKAVLREDGDLSIFTTWPGGEPAEAVFQRVSEDAITPPAAAPLPELKKVPANGLAMTPPMGWNSWNHFSSEITDEIVRGIAEGMVSSGMAAAGYEYVVIDDGWQGGRDSDGNIYPNDRFPDMKALADYVHSLGLKLGIYSSPGHASCGGYVGSYGYELEDARTFAEWGIDYLKYDWCGAQLIYESNRENVQASYQIMGEALLACGRPIVYSICNYGEADVWEWGPDAGGNLWRTTGDISDSWDQITNIAFSQYELYPYARPGHWNDPDMLEVGNGGLSLDQNQTHFTMWCMLAAPLIAGNDLRDMPQSTIDVLTNPDAIAINQDALGNQAQRLSVSDNIEVYSKALSEGERASAIFNRNEAETEVVFSWNELGWEEPPESIVNIWPKEAVPTDTSEVKFTIPTNGVVLLRGK